MESAVGTSLETARVIEQACRPYASYGRHRKHP